MRTFIHLAVPLLLASLVVAQQQTTTRNPRLAKGEHYAEVNGIKFWYRVVGGGPLLVVQAPGWGSGSSYLENGLTPLSNRFTLLLYDTRGSGHSSRPKNKNEMTTSRMVDDLEHLRQYWGLSSIDIIGHSQGGAISLGYAVRYPRAIRKLILVDSAIPGYGADAEIKNSIDERRPDKRFAGAIAEFSTEGMPKTDEEMAAVLHRLLPVYFYDPDKNLSQFEKTLGIPSVWAYDSQSSADAKLPMEVIGSMARVQAQTLVLVGSDDWICPPSVAELIHSRVLNSKLIIFNKTGHFPWVEDRDEFFTVVTNFIGN